VKEIVLDNTAVQNLDLNDLPKGTYSIKIIDNNRFSARKVILK